MRLVRPPALAPILLAVASIAAASPAAAQPAAGAGPEPPAPCLDRFRELVGEPLRYRPRALIATLPDPIDSPFAREFDALFLAFQRAMAEKGLVQDAACLTWSRQPGREEASLRDTPSVVLFRRDADLADPDSRGEVYTVLLVGELPHTGVRSQAMARALAWVARGGSFGAGGEAGEEDEPLRVLGPTFSGSARSLAVALAHAVAPGAHQEPPPPRRRLEIRSGTATSGALPAVLESVLGPEVSFRSHGTASHHLQRCVWNRLVPERLGLDTRWGVRLGLDDDCEPAGEGRDNARVALLVESSAYGSDFAGFHLVPFPTHIGALREAYRAIGPTLHGAASDAEAEDLATSLPFVASPPALQGLPPFGDKATLSSQDLVLNGSLRRLARQRVQVVAIIATNTADKLFLAEKVRAFVPDARLVTFEGDVLLAHPQFLPQTAGMLVASSSALAAPAAGSSAGAARLLFDFDGAHGVYQATLDLVGDDVAPPREVFAAVVARDGLQVLDRYEVGAGGSRAGDGPRRAAAEGGGRRAVLAAGLLGGGAGAGGMKPPVLWWLAVVVASALLGFVSWLVLHDLRGRRPLLGLVPLELVAPARWRRAEGAQLALHALVVLFPLSAGLLYFVLAVPALAGASAVPTAAALPATAVGVVAYACIGLLCVAGCYLIAGLAVRTRFELAALRGARRSRRRLVVEGGAAVLPLAVVVALAAVALGAGWLCIDRIWLRPGGADWYLVARTLSLSTGTSPVLPAMLMIAAVLAWALIVLRREEVLRRLCPRRERRPRLAAEDPAARRLVAAAGRLWAAVDPSLHGRASLRWWIGIVAVPAVYLSSLYGEGRFGAPLRGIEGPSFDGAISIVFLLLLVVIVGAGVSLARGWAALRGFAAAACCVLDRERFADAARQAAGLDDLRGVFRKLPESSPPATAAVRARVLDEDATLGAVWCDLALWLRHRESRAKSRQAAAGAAAEHAAAGAALLAQTVFRQLRHLMLFLTVALAALFFAVGSYPFEPRRVVLVYLGLLVVAAATLCVAVIVQAGRDPAVVQLAGTSETAGTWAPLVQRLSFFAGLPALSLLAGHFPQLRRLLGDWVQPLLNALR